MEIKQLLAIRQKLKEKYVHINKQFSLDEVLAAENYGLTKIQKQLLLSIWDRPGS